MPLFFFTCMKNDIPNMAKINITKNSSKQILNKAGNDMANAKSSVRIPFAPFTRRSTRPTLATRTTRKRVGDTKYFSIKSLRTKPKHHCQRENFGSKGEVGGGKTLYLFWWWLLVCWSCVCIFYIFYFVYLLVFVDEVFCELFVFLHMKIEKRKNKKFS
jgi:hypothetical protein